MVAKETFQYASKMGINSWIPQKARYFTTFCLKERPMPPPLASPKEAFLNQEYAFFLKRALFFIYIYIPTVSNQCAVINYELYILLVVHIVLFGSFILLILGYAVKEMSIVNSMKASLLMTGFGGQGLVINKRGISVSF